MEIRNQNFMEIWSKVIQGNVTFQAGCCDLIFLLITFTTSSVKRTTLVVFKITEKDEMCYLNYIAQQQTGHH